MSIRVRKTTIDIVGLTEFPRARNQRFKVVSLYLGSWQFADKSGSSHEKKNIDYNNFIDVLMANEYRINK
jgi:hypothetical protein